MNKPSGFVPIPFHLVGKFFILMGAAGTLFYGLSQTFGWFVLPVMVLVVCGVALIIGLYLRFIVPREHD